MRYVLSVKIVTYKKNIIKGHLQCLEILITKIYNYICKSEEIFYINISLQLFDKTPFVNSQNENTNSNGDFVLKTGLNVRYKISGILK